MLHNVHLHVRVPPRRQEQSLVETEVGWRASAFFKVGYSWKENHVKIYASEGKFVKYRVGVVWGGNFLRASSYHFCTQFIILYALKCADNSLNWKIPLPPPAPNRVFVANAAGATLFTIYTLRWNCIPVQWGHKSIKFSLRKKIAFLCVENFPRIFTLFHQLFRDFTSTLLTIVHSFNYLSHLSLD